MIDFGDTNKNPIIFELGITIMYMMTQCKSIHPNEAGGHVLAGYETIRTLPPIGLRHLVQVYSDFCFSKQDMYLFASKVEGTFNNDENYVEKIFLQLLNHLFFKYNFIA